MYTREELGSSTLIDSQPDYVPQIMEDHTKNNSSFPKERRLWLNNERC
jgi:hypothetical protein